MYYDNGETIVEMKNNNLHKNRYKYIPAIANGMFMKK